MTLHVIYRAAPGRGKNRPDQFSKAVCLASLLRAVEAVGDEARITFVVDGDLPDHVVRVMSSRGVLITLGGIGNSSSYRAAVSLAVDGDPDDVVYLCEDDYLHVEHALATFWRACRSAPVGTFFTLYDHPDRYRRTDDLIVPGRPVVLLDEQHWRTVESSAMTFGARRDTLQRDRILLDGAARFTRYPHDRAMWRTIQALGMRRPLGWIRRPQRRLLSPIPSLATHVETGMMAASVAWEDVYREASAHARRIELQGQHLVW